MRANTNNVEAYDDEPWLMDLGASHHMTLNKHLFNEYMPLQKQVMIKLGNENIIYAEGKGTIRIKLDVNSKQTNNTLTDVLYAPKLCQNLFSIGKALSDGMEVHFHSQYATFFNKNKPVLMATRYQNLYNINGKTIAPEPENTTANITYTDQTNNIQLWHK